MSLQIPINKIALISFESADQAVAILTDWIKLNEDNMDTRVWHSVDQVRTALGKLMDDADVIMLEDN
jgi:hypothetical protein